MSWDIPTGDKCPECAQALVLTARGNIKCSNKDCSYKIRVEKPKTAKPEFKEGFDEPPYPEEPIYDENGGFIFTDYDDEQ